MTLPKALPATTGAPRRNRPAVVTGPIVRSSNLEFFLARAAQARVEGDEADIVLHPPAEQGEQLFEQELGGDDRRPGVEAETVLLEHLRAPAEHRRPVDQRHRIPLGAQAQRCRHAAEAAADHHRARRITREGRHCGAVRLVQHDPV